MINPKDATVNIKMAMVMGASRNSHESIYAFQWSADIKHKMLIYGICIKECVESIDRYGNWVMLSIKRRNTNLYIVLEISLL